MAIVIANPIKILAGDEGPNLVFPSNIWVHSVHWISSGASPGHLAEIQDPSGKTRWKSVAAGPYFDSGEQLIEDMWEGGFKVTTLQSGELHVHFE